MYVTLTASHWNPVRRAFVEAMLESTQNLTIKPDKVLISVSYVGEKPDLNWYRERLAGIPHEVEFHPDGHNSAVSQLNHYMHLLRKLDRNDFVLFIDDDDAHHPDRIKLVKEQVARTPNVLLVHHRLSIVVGMHPSKLRKTRDGMSGEHVCSVVRSFVALYALQLLGPEARANNECDLTFSVLTESLAYEKVAKIDLPLYFYTRTLYVPNFHADRSAGLPRLPHLKNRPNHDDLLVVSREYPELFSASELRPEGTERA